ncbi:MAG: ATP-binding cassette domain-containing protein [Bryobacteraceae bacterium]
MPQAAGKSVLRFKGVSLFFEGAAALQDVSFEVTEGQTRILFGSAGSGKTVLLKVALGLLKPSVGSVYVFGQEITDFREEDLYEVRSRIGMLFQESALFDSMTIAENVAYPLLNQKSISVPPEEVMPRVEQALRFVELEHTLDKFPSELSGGMRRRVAIARAVVTEPPLLLYDSPTAGLDPITANTIMALIVKERDLSNATTLIVTHRYQDANLVAKFRYNRDLASLEPVLNGNSGPGGGTAHRTVFMIMQDGRLIFEGSQGDLEASTDPYITKFVRRVH